MSPSAPRLAIRGLLALPGRVGAMCVAPASGVLAAGDDRGEAGLWNADGSRRASLRLESAVAWADVWSVTDGLDDVRRPAGSAPVGVRAAFVGAAGDALLTAPGGATIRLRVKPGQRVLLDRAGLGFFAVDSQRGEVQVHDAAGCPIRRFKVPWPVESAVGVARAGGLAVVSKQGVAGRFSAAGSMLWGGDYRRYTAGLASDPQGRRVIVCFLSFGAEVLDAATGARIGVLDVGRPVECAAASSSHIALGCSDGTVVLLDRDGRVVAEGRAPSKVVGIGLAHDAQMFVRLADGTVRIVGLEAAATAGAVPVATPAEFPLSATGSHVVARRKLLPSASAPSRVVVAVAPDGSRVVVGESRDRAVLLDAHGRVVAETPHAGPLLAAWVAPSGEAWLATSQEIRRSGPPDGPPAPAQVRAFASQIVRAVWTADGSTLVAVDELGTARMLDRETGADQASLPCDRNDRPVTIAGTAVATAVETASGTIRCFGDGWNRTVSLRSAARGGKARLLTATTAGPILLVATDLTACGWDGRPRWVLGLREAPVAVHVLADDRLLVVLAKRMRVVERDGRASAVLPRPEGTLACVCGGGPGTFMPAWRDGRRLSVSGLDGAIRFEETFETPVVSVVSADRGGLLVAVIERAVVMVRAPEPAGSAAAVPSHDRASSTAIG